VATDCHTGPKEILGESEFGLLVPENTSAALASAIERLLENDVLREDYAERARRRAHEFDISRIGPRYASLLNEILSSR
jgi:glycosyltransferase involved in cell wall biosynthesis